MTARETALIEYKVVRFKKQTAAGIPLAVGCDVGPLPHGTQAQDHADGPLRREATGGVTGRHDQWSELLGWAGQTGELKPGYYADIVAVPGNPLGDIPVVERVSFVMKNGEMVRLLESQAR